MSIPRAAGLAWALACVMGCASAPASGRHAPDIAWDGWWPSSQWAADDAPPSEARVRATARSWKYIQFHPVETTWGEARATLQKIEMAPGYAPRHGLTFWLSFDREGDELVWIKEGDLEAAIVSGSEVIAKPTNGPPITRGGSGRMGVMTTVVGIEFPWLPDTGADFWVRLTMKERTCWVLIPYGFGAEESKPPSEPVTPRGQPARPAGAGTKDPIVPWKYVEFDLGGPDVRFYNEGDARAELTLAKSGSRDWNTWAIARPRTTMAIGIPGGGVLFSSCRSVTRGDDNIRRKDRFHFYRQPDDRRVWGLLRVTIEEEAFELAIPSSLFHYLHGG